MVIILMRLCLDYWDDELWKVFWINLTTYGSLAGSNVLWLSSTEYLEDSEDQGKCKMKMLVLLHWHLSFVIILQHSLNVYMMIRKFSRSIQILLTGQTLKNRHCLRFKSYHIKSYYSMSTSSPVHLFAIRGRWKRRRGFLKFNFSF